MDLNDLKNLWRHQRMERFINLLRKKNPNIKTVSNVRLLMGINEKTYKKIKSKQIKEKRCVSAVEKDVLLKIEESSEVKTRKSELQVCNVALSPLKAEKDSKSNGNEKILQPGKLKISMEALVEEKENDSSLLNCNSSLSPLFETKDLKRKNTRKSQNVSKSEEKGTKDFSEQQKNSPADKKECLLDCNYSLPPLQSQKNLIKSSILTELGISSEDKENVDSRFLPRKSNETKTKVEKMTNSMEIKPRVISSLPLELTAKFESLSISNHSNDLGASEINPDKGLNGRNDEKEAEGSNNIPQNYHNFETLKNWLQSNKKIYGDMEKYLTCTENNLINDETKENDCKLTFLKKVLVDLCRMTSVGFPLEESEKILNEFSTMSDKIKDEPIYLQCKTLINVIKDKVNVKNDDGKNIINSSNVEFKILKSRKKKGEDLEYFMTPVRRSARQKNQKNTNQASMSEPPKILKFKPNEFLI